MDRIHFRVSYRRCYWVAVWVLVAWGGAVGCPTAFGQLRTGRSGSRDFYTDARQASFARDVQTDGQTDNKVVQAGCRSCVQDTIAAEGTVESSERVVENEGGDRGELYGICGACGDANGDCGCDGLPHISIRLAFPFARAFENLSVRMEAATFWRNDPTIPPLVRSAAIGTPGSIDLFGGTVAMDETTQGYRGEAAWRFENDGCTSILVRFFDAGAQSLTFDTTGSNLTSIVRPYFDPVSNQQDSISVREPGTSSGNVLAYATSDLSGGDLLLKQVAYRSRYSKLDFLVGYQTALLTDSIFVNSVTQAPAGTFLDLRDRFDTSNRFHGGAVGLSGIAYAPRWSVSGMFKLGLGNMNRYVGIDGDQRITVGSPPVTSVSDQGLLARATNNGMYQFDTFVVSPEANVTLGYRLTRRLEATVGYNYLLLPKVARADDQIDPNSASNLSDPLTGAARPLFQFTETNLGLHSLNYGLQYRY
ncbi:MAG: BBP7 family outer membrane beta-barrel protein [Planctomycetota bacterium]|jgi:hypothetical protein